MRKTTLTVEVLHRGSFNDMDVRLAIRKGMGRIANLDREDDGVVAFRIVEPEELRTPWCEEMGMIATEKKLERTRK